MSESSIRVIRTPNQRLCMFVSSTLQEAASARHQPERAAQLLGVHDNLVETMGVTIPVFWERAIHQPLLADLRTQLDEAAFNAAWAAGRKMTLDTAIVYALGEA